jgi:hypothetical protein
MTLHQVCSVFNIFGTMFHLLIFGAAMLRQESTRPIGMTAVRLVDPGKNPAFAGQPERR